LSEAVWLNLIRAGQGFTTVRDSRAESDETWGSLALDLALIPVFSKGSTQVQSANARATVSSAANIKLEDYENLCRRRRPRC
jgi:hypothetical protein